MFSINGLFLFLFSVLYLFVLTLHLKETSIHYVLFMKCDVNLPIVSLCGAQGKYGYNHQFLLDVGNKDFHYEKHCGLKGLALELRWRGNI